MTSDKPVQENQKEGLTQGIMIYKKEEQGGKSGKLGIDSDLFYKQPVAFHFFHATWIKWDNHTMLMTSHHFQNSILGGRVSIHTGKCFVGSVTPNPVGKCSIMTSLIIGFSNHCSSFHKYHPPTQRSPGIQQVLCFPGFSTGESFVPVRTKIAKTVTSIPETEVPIINLLRFWKSVFVGA